MGGGRKSVKSVFLKKKIAALQKRKRSTVKFSLFDFPDFQLRIECDLPLY